MRGDRDNPGQVQHLEHFQQPSVAAASVAEERAAAVAGAAPDARILAREYLKEGAPIYGLAESELPDDAAVGLAAAAAATGSKLQLAEQKKMSDTYDDFL